LWWLVFSNLSPFNTPVIVVKADNHVLKSVLPHFRCNKRQKSPDFNNLHDLSNHTFTLFPKDIQVVDWDGLVRSFLFEATESGGVKMWRGGLGLACLYPALSFAGASLSKPCPVSTSARRTGQAH
jgi:hypothetical protein